MKWDSGGMHSSESLRGEAKYDRVKSNLLFVVGITHKWMKGPLQPVTPFFQSQLDCQELPIASVVVSFSGGQLI